MNGSTPESVGGGLSLSDIAEVACARSDAVHIVEHDPARYLEYCNELLGDATSPSTLLLLRDEQQQAAFVLIRDCINFGSGFHLELVKRPGLSGARTIEAALLENVQAHGEPDGRWLAGVTPSECAEMFGQPRSGAPMELMTMFATAWNEFGALLCERYDGQVAGLVEDAGDQPGRMIELLGHLSCWRDIAHFEELTLPFMKRARLSVLGLEVAARLHGRRRFVGVADIASFADNLIPHVLKIDGLLAFAPELETRIERGCLLEYGSPEEVSIRAGAVAVCARLASVAASAGRSIMPLEVASRLWKRGQKSVYKQRPRHRSRCFAY
jgi:hypothetical protein